MLLLLYQPGSAQATRLFFDELTTHLESLVVLNFPVIIGGDFNIHMNDVDDNSPQRLSTLLSTFAMNQFVNSPTHKHGHTLDLVIADESADIQSITVEPAGIVSDHGLVISEHLSHKNIRAMASMKKIH